MAFFIWVAFEDAVLFMWAVAPKLDVGMDVLRAWGFSYKSNRVWDKEKLGMGYWGRIQHEHLLIGVRGKMESPPLSVLPRSVHREKSVEHSRKPDHFRDAITKMYRGQEKLEMFARGKPPEGWTYWGNQSEAA